MPFVRFKMSITLLVLTIQAALPFPVFADYALNMTRGVTTISKEVYDLHMLTLWMVTLIGILVFGLMIWSIIHHRKSKGAKAAHFHHSSKWEAVWTIIPIIILLAFAAPATRTLIVMEDSGEAEMIIKVTGYQWRWHYEYLEEDFGFFSSLDSVHNEARQLGSGIDVSKIENYLLEVDNPIVIPVETKVLFMLTSNDVIHAWWVPELGWKRDAIPGFVNANWTQVNEPGIYRGQCAELCGKDHGFMPIVLKAVPKDEYMLWVQDQKRIQAEAEAGADRVWTMAELMERGEQVYGSTCAGCHQVNGQGLPPTFPALTGSSVTTGPMEDHLDVVVNGSAGTTMQAFGRQLNVVDIAAVVTFERNALGNSVGDMVQPASVPGPR
ncbi:MAG: cytochrome c oxidase subunit 2 [Gammaproteobacteria bacterium]|jgi:cytochrome c oxidase subunit 2